MTIRVYLKSPLPPNETILLDQNLNYTVTPLSNTFQIGIISLPAEFAVPGTYDFFVSYSLASGSFRLAVKTYGYNVSSDLFRNLLRVYYLSFSRNIHRDRRSVSRVPVDSLTKIGGLSLAVKPFRLSRNIRLWIGMSALQNRGRVKLIMPAQSQQRFLQRQRHYVNKHYFSGHLDISRGRSMWKKLRPLRQCPEGFSFQDTCLFSIGGSYSRFQGLSSGESSP